ncbi:6,7-dimethyl-8-ribityllumazine synthase [Anseongella ginsenosidimutans]|uniref:6,7-dimethyl-8-ribityllumazine synthase n=1 Tax=Anseongella ginsenosidimutans TaxID=496056 RepID=A0A4R3KLT3_9SPHI|nr:6,7-dimethyl-8-ribityllumazine synthase [Anseongella ginsenosidimutans]QEC54089.1 6,7-dimethyl-8-ribityllumazine synthase [Anseongella ginsenosidimutans]TCS85140.1 6,7-dimethyl-8-ribityllumazine synthase [Anseongella ginsenosidimutans]
MSSIYKNLSDFSDTTIPPAKGFRFGIVVAEWNKEITESLYEGAFQTLLGHGAEKEAITRINVPGSFELTAGAAMLAEKGNYDAVICLGCVIQGETRHFDFICQAVAAGLTELSVKYSKSFVFGVLTPNTMQQALDRAGGKHGNKGDEAAVTAIKMAALARRLS